MISLKKYLNSNQSVPLAVIDEDSREVLPAALKAYRSALVEMGNCSTDACPALGDDLKRELGRLEAGLETAISREQVETTQKSVHERLQDWGRRTAAHYRHTTGEVRDLLVEMARAVETVGERDQRCASQLNSVTDRLEGIASLDDLAEIHASIEQSATDLKRSLDRMATEGKAAVEQLRTQVSLYQAKLEIAEDTASRDALTGLRNRAWMESRIESRLVRNWPLTVAIFDIDGFKAINDRHGHLVGDELLRMFAGELQSASGAGDPIGRWGGDEFILALDCSIVEAKAQMDRLTAWACGGYKISGSMGPIEVKVDASIGLAERTPDESMVDLLARAEAEMYKKKQSSNLGRMRLRG